MAPAPTAPYFQHLSHHLSTSVQALGISRPHTISPTLNDISIPQLTCTFKVLFSDTNERWDAKCFFSDPDMRKLMGGLSTTPGLKHGQDDHQRARARRRASNEAFTRERLRLLDVTSSVPVYYGSNLDPPPGLPSIIFLSSPAVSPLTPDVWERATVRVQDAILSSLAKHIAEVVRGCVRATQMYKEKGRAEEWDPHTWFRRRAERRVGDVLEGRKMGDLRAAKSLRDAIDDLLRPYASLEHFVPMLHHKDLSAETLMVTPTMDVFVPVTPHVPSPLPLHVILGLPAILEPLSPPTSLTPSLLRQRSSFNKSLFHHLHSFKLGSALPDEIIHRMLGDWRAMIGLGCAAGVWGEEGYDVWQHQWGRMAKTKGWDGLQQALAKLPAGRPVDEEKSEWSFHGDEVEEPPREDVPAAADEVDCPSVDIQGEDDKSDLETHQEEGDGGSVSGNEVWYDADESPPSPEDIPPPVPPKPKPIPPAVTRRAHSSLRVRADALDTDPMFPPALPRATTTPSHPSDTPELLYATSPVSQHSPATPSGTTLPPVSGRRNLRRQWSIGSWKGADEKHHARKGSSTEGMREDGNGTKGPPVKGLGLKGLVRVGLGRLSRRGSMEDLAGR